MQVHYCENNDFIRRVAIKQSEGKVPEKFPANVGMHRRSGIGVGSYCIDGSLNLGQESVPQVFYLIL